MKITNYVIVFFLVLITVGTAGSMKAKELSTIVEEEKQYNQSLDSALLSATDAVVEVSDGELHMDKDEMVERFMKSMYAAFNLSDDETLQEAFKVYVPVLAVADVDGLSVHFNNYEGNKVRGVWTSVFPYTYTEGDFVINFHLDDEVVVTDSTTGKMYTFDVARRADEITAVNYPNDWQRAKKILELKSVGAEYYNYKTYAVTECITEHLTYYANLNNELAEAFGVSYTFALPESASSDIGRAVDDVTFMALFQGYPIGAGDEVYSKFAIAGTRILKNDGYYLAIVDGVMYYHKPACRKGTAANILTYSTKEACAAEGAMPCPYCKP